MKTEEILKDDITSTELLKDNYSREEVIKLLYKLEKEIKEPRSLYDNQGMDNWIKQNLK